MLFHTTGLVFKVTKFKENSAIVNIYTHKFGLKSYIINGLYSTKSKNKIAYYQPLNLLELVVYNKNSSSINRIKEQKFSYMYRDIPFNFIKKTIIQVVNEVLINCIKEEEPNEQLFEFLTISLKNLDETKSTSYYLIQFLIKLSHFLGFAPLNNFSQINAHFDLQQGVFVDESFQTANTLNIEKSEKFAQILQVNYENLDQLKFSRKDKRQILDAILLYFRHQIEHFRALKSLTILNELFENLSD